MSINAEKQFRAIVVWQTSWVLFLSITDSMMIMGNWQDIPIFKFPETLTLQAFEEIVKDFLSLYNNDDSMDIVYAYNLWTIDNI